MGLPSPLAHLWRNFYSGMPATKSCQSVMCVAYKADKRSILCGSSTFTRSSSAKSGCLQAWRKARASLFHCTFHCRCAEASTHHAISLHLTMDRTPACNKKTQRFPKMHSERTKTIFFEKQKTASEKWAEEAAKKWTGFFKEKCFKGPASSEKWHRANF